MSERALCGAPKRTGTGTCTQTAGAGTDHRGVGRCRVHGGTSPSHRVHGARLLADMNLRRELAKMAVPLEGNVDPQQMLLAMVREAAGNVAYLGARVAELADVTEEEAEGLRAGAGKWTRLTAYQKGAYLFGPKIDVDKEGDEHVTGEEVRGIVKLYGEWVDRLAKFAKMAIDAGIAKAQVEIAQQQGQTIVVVINRVLAQIGVPEEQMVLARELIAGEFRELARAEAKKVGP